MSITEILPGQLEKLYSKYLKEQNYPGTTDFSLELEAGKYGVSPKSLRNCFSQADLTGKLDTSALEESKSAWELS